MPLVQIKNIFLSAAASSLFPPSLPPPKKKMSALQSVSNNILQLFKCTISYEACDVTSLDWAQSTNLVSIIRVMLDCLNFVWRQTTL